MHTSSIFHPAKGSACPVTGIAITDWICWKNPNPASDYSFSICRLGQSVVWAKASGYVTLADMNEAMGLLHNFLSQTKIGSEKLVYIEDYSEVKGAHYRARINYINAMSPIQDIFSAGVFYGLSPLFKFSYHLYLRFGRPKSRMHLVDSYQDAIITALSILKEFEKNDIQPTVSRKNRLEKNPPLVDTTPASSEETSGRIFASLKNLFRIRKGKSNHLSSREIERYIQDIQLFISTIDWNKNGVGQYDRFLSPGNPFRTVYDAIGFMKSDLDTVIDQRDKAYDLLKASEERYRYLVEHARAGIYELDFKTGIFTSVNDIIVEITGYTREELLNKKLIDMLCPESIPVFQERIKILQSGNNIHDQAEYKIRCKNGEERWALVHGRYKFENGTLVKSTGAVTDITKLKNTERDLIEYRDRLRILSVRVADSEEKERRKIASYIHDHINQRVAVINMKMGSLSKSCTVPGIMEEIQDIREMMRSVMEDMRLMTVELSPNVLYELGFNEAVDWLAERAAKEHGLNTTVYKNDTLDNLHEDQRIILFRVISELIHNVAKHANADEIKIDLGEPADETGHAISIRDNGKGFDTEKIWSAPQLGGGFGLFSVREKMFSLGGRLEIESAPGSGTLVRLTFPSSNSMDVACEN